MQEGVDDTRQRYRRAPHRLPPDARIAVHLLDGEQLLALRERATLVTIDGSGTTSSEVRGGAYLTDFRLLHLDTALPSWIDLDDIVELSVATDRLLLTLNGSRGAILQMKLARQFRSQVAAAVSAHRSR